MPEHINLRGDAGDPAFLAAVEGVLGFALPVEANTVRLDPRLRGDDKVRGDESVAYWLGPDEWLIATRGDGARLAAALREALGATFSAVTEVGGGNVVFVLDAASAREVLAQECPLDLDPAVFHPGRCAQTRFAKAAVLLRALEGGAVELTVRRSFAGYLRHWLDNHSKEAR